MSSQEDYLDQLLRNITNGGNGQPRKDNAENTVPSETVSGEAAEAVEEMDSVGEAMEMSSEIPDAMSQEMMDAPEAMETLDAADAVEEMRGMSDEISDAEEAPETFEMPDMPELSEISEVTAEPEVLVTEEISEKSGDVSEVPDTPDIMEEVRGMADEMAETGEVSGTTGIEPKVPDAVEETSEIFDDVSKTVGMSDMPELSGILEMPETSEDAGDTFGTLVEDPDVAELLKSFEDDASVPDENTEETEQPSMALTPDLADEISQEKEPEPSETADISSMSEEEIERLLADSRGISGNSAEGSEESFQGDVVDLLEGTQDSELQEIQDLLEKSDNNEAVGGEIEDLLRGAEQDDHQDPLGGSRAGVDADGAGEQLSPKQQKAMEKKRIKEEKSAARKSQKEAKKAEKAARKAAKKGKGSAQGADGAPDGGVSGGADVETGESVDTAFLDSILSEAGKIDGAETVSSATGNYDAKVDNIIPDESEEVSGGQGAAGRSGSSVNADFGIDLNDLFGDSSGAESAMMAGGGDSDFPDFVALDGEDVTGIMELAGGEEEEESKPKKKGFFSRFLEFLTEEDEEEEEENENIKLSEENQGIIEDLDKEKNKKDKKGKKSKKKAKKADASAEGEEDGGDGEEEKTDKKKKAKKPKKEKLPKEEEPVDPKNRLSLRKVLPVVLICLSLGVAIVIIAFVSVDFTDKKVARDAYYEGDYRTCYQNLYGKDMNETEQIMYGKSESILTIRLWISEYEMLTAEGARLEALDSLIQSVNDYPALYEYAIQWNAGGEVAQEYATILNLLYENYGLTEDQARAIAAEPDDIEYTRQVNIIVQGGAYGSWNEPEPVEELPLQDELPEETELPEGNFIDTNTSAQ